MTPLVKDLDHFESIKDHLKLMEQFGAKLEL